MTGMYFILAVLTLGVLVFIHELGHYFMAKKMGMTIEIFSIGFGISFVRVPNLLPLPPARITAFIF